MVTGQVWRQDFSYGHCVGLDEGLFLEAGFFLWPLCRSGGMTFLWSLCRSGGRTILMVTGQVWRQDFSYGHCAGLEA